MLIAIQLDVAIQIIAQSGYFIRKLSFESHDKLVEHLRY